MSRRSHQDKRHKPHRKLFRTLQQLQPPVPALHRPTLDRIVVEESGCLIFFGVFQPGVTCLRVGRTECDPVGAAVHFFRELWPMHIGWVAPLVSPCGRGRCGITWLRRFPLRPGLRGTYMTRSLLPTVRPWPLLVICWVVVRRAVLRERLPIPTGPSF